MHQDSITFRSTKAKKQSFGESQKTTQHHGGSWSHIREYRDGDESRDIVWRKAQEKKLFSLEREENANFDIILFSAGEKPGDTFSTPNFPLSKKEYKELLVTKIAESAKKGHHTYIYKEGTIGEKALEKSQPKDTLICIIDDEYLPLYKTLSHHNDVIFLFVVHPFEEDPEEDILFLGKALKRGQYKKAFLEYKNTLAETMKKSGGIFLTLYTHESIEKKMNYFFKNRYRKT